MVKLNNPDDSLTRLMHKKYMDILLYSFQAFIINCAVTNLSFNMEVRFIFHLATLVFISSYIGTNKKVVK